MCLDEIISYDIVQADIMSWDEQESNYVWKLAVCKWKYSGRHAIHWTYWMCQITSVTQA